MEWYWAALIIGFAVFFAIGEGFAVITHRFTLSRTIWTWSKHFPLLPWIAGVLVGGLAVHFWWEGAYCAPATPILGTAPAGL